MAGADAKHNVTLVTRHITISICLGSHLSGYISHNILRDPTAPQDHNDILWSYGAVELLLKCISVPADTLEKYSTQNEDKLYRSYCRDLQAEVIVVSALSDNRSISELRGFPSDKM